MRIKGYSLLALFIVTMLTANSLQADQSTMIKYRQGHLAAMGGHTGAVFQLLGDTDIPAAHLTTHARALVRLVNLLNADLKTMFPAGSGSGKTDALPEIWEDWDKFNAAADKAKSKADAVAAALDGDDKGALGGAMKDLVDACKACHKKFRKEQ